MVPTCIPKHKWMKIYSYRNLHFFDECSIGLRIGATLITPHSSSWMEEVNSEISVITFYRLRDVLDCGNVKRDGNPKHR
jgi:hypothetical protein